MQDQDPGVVANEGSTVENEPALLERGRAWLEQVLQSVGLDVKVKVAEDYLEIDSAGLSEVQKSCLLGFPPIIGNSRPPGTEPLGMGITLDALQYLANTLLNLNQPAALQRSYLIELDGYRQRRQGELQAMALVAVDQVRSSGTEYEFKALSAAERRQLHTFFDNPDYADLESFSRGREPDRRLVIRPTQEKPLPTE